MFRTTDETLTPASLRSRSFAGWIFLAFFSALCLLARAEEPVTPNTVDLVLVSFDIKNQAIKAVHEVSGMSFTESKALVERVPAAILGGVSKEEAEKAAAHAKQLSCKVEIRPAQPGAVQGPARKFDLVLTKSGPSASDSAKAVAAMMGKDIAAAQDALKVVPLTLLSNLSSGDGETKIEALEVAGCAAELVSNGGLETGGVTVMLNKIEPVKKIAVIATVREYTGLSLKRAKELVEAAPRAVKIKMARDEAEKLKAALEANKAVVSIKESGR